MPLLVSAIVLNFRSPQDTARCVKALLNQTIAERLEILIVDNHSDDESIGTIRAKFHDHPQIRIIESRDNCGYGQGNNLAASYAQGQYLLIINPDNTLPPDAVEKMIEIFRHNKEAGIVGPGLVYPDGTFRPSARRFPSMFELVRKRLNPAKWHADYYKVMSHESRVMSDEASLESEQSNRHSSEDSKLKNFNFSQDSRLKTQDSSQSSSLKAHSYTEVDWLVGACLLIPKDLYDDLSGFDPRFFLFFEDIDLCRRCWQKKRTVLYVPSIQVLDRKQRLSEGGILAPLLKKMTRIHLASAVKYFWKWRRVASVVR